MRIKIDQWEVCIAIQKYLQETYGIECDLDPEGLNDNPVIEYKERTYAWKTHKNGKEVKDKHGLRTRDHSKTTIQTNHIDWEEFDSITFYL
jgi:hypothetical protein|tara:strand:- start:465 stop:737 length:273 start_codon:yes stop_codon:yes gene_type:complete